MPYDEYVADRIKQVLHERKVNFEEKKMMGGLAIMVDDKMCVGIIKNELMVRVDPDKVDDLILKLGCRRMDFTGRPMKGFLQVGPQGIDQDTDLAGWIQLALDFNLKAKSSKKKKQ